MEQLRDCRARGDAVCRTVYEWDCDFGTVCAHANTPSGLPLVLGIPTWLHGIGGQHFACWGIVEDDSPVYYDPVFCCVVTELEARFRERLTNWRRATGLYNRLRRAAP